MEKPACPARLGSKGWAGTAAHYNTEEGKQQPMASKGTCRCAAASQAQGCHFFSAVAARAHEAHCRTGRGSELCSLLASSAGSSLVLAQVWHTCYGLSPYVGGAPPRAAAAAIMMVMGAPCARPPGGGTGPIDAACRCPGACCWAAGGRPAAHVDVYRKNKGTEVPGTSGPRTHQTAHPHPRSRPQQTRCRWAC